MSRIFAVPGRRLKKRAAVADAATQSVFRRIASIEKSNPLPGPKCL
jgi:hypothetical protein